ncbi:hypothetical protein ACHAWF_004728 [Thalassiosira exigua]
MIDAWVPLTSWDASLDFLSQELINEIHYKYPPSA